MHCFLVSCGEFPIEEYNIFLAIENIVSLIEKVRIST